MKLSLSQVVGTVVVGAALCGVSAKAQTTNAVPVINYLWNSNSATDGSYTITTVGWNLTGSGAVNATLNRTTSPYIGQTGDQLGQVFTLGSYTGFLQQVLTNDFTPGDTYTFTADIDNDAGMSGWNLSINQAGIAILASTPITQTAANTLSPFSVSWTDPLVGQPGSLSSPIELSLYNLSGTPAYTGIEIDNAQLSDISPVPEPSTWVLFGVGLFGTLLMARKVRRANS